MCQHAASCVSRLDVACHVGGRWSRQRTSTCARHPAALLRAAMMSTAAAPGARGCERLRARSAHRSPRARCSVQPRHLVVAHASLPLHAPHLSGLRAQPQHAALRLSRARGERSGGPGARRVVAAAGPEKGKGGPPRPQDDPEYYSRLLKLEADPVPRDNLTSNLKLGAGFVFFLAGLVYAFLASNGVV